MPLSEVDISGLWRRSNRGSSCELWNGVRVGLCSWPVKRLAVPVPRRWGDLRGSIYTNIQSSWVLILDLGWYSKGYSNVLLPRLQHNKA